MTDGKSRKRRSTGTLHSVSYCLPKPSDCGETRTARSGLDLTLVRLASLTAHSRSALAAENLFLRKQLALFHERKVKPRRADDSTRWMMATLSRMFQWHDALVNVKPNTLLR